MDKNSPVSPRLRPSHRPAKVGQAQLRRVGLPESPFSDITVRKRRSFSNVVEVSMTYARTAAFVVCSFVATSNIHAQENEGLKTTETLKSIIDVAASLCRSAPLEHIKQGAQGAIRADVENSVIGKIAGIKGEGEAKVINEVTKGLREEQFLVAIKDENNCKIAVFNKLTEKLFLSQDKTGDNNKYWLQQARVSPYEVGNSAQLCSKLKSVVISAIKSFKGDIVKSSLGRGA
jgi:hypothetical protein